MHSGLEKSEGTIWGQQISQGVQSTLLGPWPWVFSAHHILTPLGPRQNWGSHSRREPRASGALGRSQLAADRQALPQPPLYSLHHITVLFLFSSLPMWHFTRNLTDLTSHWEKVYHRGRQPRQPIRFSHTSRLQAFCLPGAARGREKMRTLLHSPFCTSVCIISILSKLPRSVFKWPEHRQKGTGCWEQRCRHGNREGAPVVKNLEASN